MVGTATRTPTSCASGLSLHSTNVDQIALITQTLGGTVTQVGGTGNGNSLTTASNFSGAPSATTGVSVNVPTYVFASSVPASNLSGNSEPGNVTAVVLGTPTDLTFTLPGSGGPDMTDGDGSLVMGNSGNFVTLDYGFCNFVASSCAPRGIVIFTDSTGGGTASVELLSSGSTVASLNVTIPGNSPGTGLGAVNLTVNGLTFDSIRISRVSGAVEIDAVGVSNALCQMGGGAAPLAPSVCGNGVLDTGEECDDGNNNDGDGCSKECRTETEYNLTSEFCSLSQGGWHGPLGHDFVNRYPTLLPAIIGGPEESTQIDTFAALSAYMPRGGTPHEMYPGEREFESAGDVVDDGGGVLSGQTMALTLAISLSAKLNPDNDQPYGGLGSIILPHNAFCTQGVTAGDDGIMGTEDDVVDAQSAVQSFALPSSVTALNTTVNDLLMFANQYLRGAESGNPEIGDVNQAVTTINQAFDGCRQIVTCP